MLPANLAKTRTAGRGTYGELVVLNNAASPTPITLTNSAIGVAGPSNASSHLAVGSMPATTIRYTPYPLSSTLSANQNAVASGTAAHIIPLTGHSIIQYATPAQTIIETPTSVQPIFKRYYTTRGTGATASNTSFRSHPVTHQQSQSARTTATLSYPLGDLFQVQGLDLSQLYSLPPATFGV